MVYSYKLVLILVLTCPQPNNTLFWYGLDLRWAYADMLPNIYRQTVCKQTALDILHEALVRFALAKNPDRTQRPHAFLQVIVRNVLIDEHYHQRRFVSLTPEVNEDGDEIYTEFSVNQCFAPSAEHLADIQQRLQAMQALINGLPPKCRKAFWLFRIEGLDQSEIATQLGVSRNMVQRHVMRAMLELLEAEDLIR